MSSPVTVEGKSYKKQDEIRNASRLCLAQIIANAIGLSGSAPRKLLKKKTSTKSVSARIENVICGCDYSILWALIILLARVRILLLIKVFCG